MSLNPNQIAAALSVHGFALVFFENSGDLVTVRQRSPGLFDRIHISVAQRRDRVGVDYVAAWAESAIVPGRTAVRGMIESSLIELPGADEDGSMNLIGTVSWATWLSHLVDRAPKAVDELANEVGPRLLSATARARNAANEYLELIRKLGGTALDTLRRSASGRGIADARRILEEPIVLIPGRRDVYELASLAISIYQQQVEGADDWLTNRQADDSADRELMIRLQYMASRLSHERGWPT